jgi:hypothetical protein
VLLAGIVLRLWGIDFGLPYILHQDEPIVVNHAMAYGTGDLNPHFFVIPPLPSYIVFFFYGLYFLAGKAIGYFSSANDLAALFFADPTSFYMVARASLGFVPSVLSVLFVRKLYGEMFSDTKGAVYASAVMAVSFINVVNAHYAYADNLMVLCVIVSMMYFWRVARDPSAANYIFSGALLGISAGVKYNAAILVVPFAAAHFLFSLRSGKGSPAGKNALFLASFAVCALAFAAVNPFSVIDHVFFLDSVLHRIRGCFMGPWYHLKYSLAEGVGLVLATFSMIGFMSVAHDEKWRKFVFFASFPLVFYLHLTFKSQPFSRYVLPLIPFAAMACSYLLFNFFLPALRLPRHRRFLYALAFFLLAVTSAKSVKACLLFGGEDTRAVSASWIEENIPPGAKIAVDHTAYRPMISQTKEQIEAKAPLIAGEDVLASAKKAKMGYLVKSLEGKKTYNVFFLTPEEGENIQFLSQSPEIAPDVAKLRAAGIGYVAVNYNLTDKNKKKMLKVLDGQADIIMKFSPYYDGMTRRPFDMNDYTYMAIGSRELFSRKTAGPAIVVYKIRAAGNEKK